MFWFQMLFELQKMLLLSHKHPREMCHLRKIWSIVMYYTCTHIYCTDKQICCLCVWKHDGHTFWETYLQITGRTVRSSQRWLPSEDWPLIAKHKQGGPVASVGHVSGAPAPASWLQVSGQLDLAETIFCFSNPFRLEIKWELQLVNGTRAAEWSRDS